jgi:predicted acyl esterase
MAPPGRFTGNSFNMIKSATMILLLALCLAACDQHDTDAEATDPQHDSETASNTESARPPARASSFGHYEGYSEPVFDGFVRESVYVPVNDGTRLALDIYHPTAAGVKSSRPLPVALQVTRYWRAFEKDDGTLLTSSGEIPSGQNKLQFRDPSIPPGADENANTNQELMRHGYVVVAMDSRGTGSSFGVQSADLSLEIQDMKTIIDWLAAQDWSTDKVGMLGASWLGFIQFVAALGNPEPLAAIFPTVANFPDFQRIGSARGAYIKGAMLTMRKTLVGLSEVKDEGQSGTDALASIFGEGIVGPARVDEDVDGSLRQLAREGQGSATFEMYIAPILAHPAIQQAIETLGLDSPDKVIDTLFYADALNEALKGKPELRAALTQAQWPQPQQTLAIVDFMLTNVNKANVPSYIWDGWQDPMPNERILWYYNLEAPRRLTMGPWSHGPDEPDDPSARAYTALMTTEVLRWFDYWLKDIDNGVMDEDPLVYAVMQDKNSWEWRHGRDFPPPEASTLPLYFSAGPSGSIESANDGFLVQTAPGESGQKDEYTVDYTANSGEHTRYHDAAGGGPIEYLDLAPNDAKGLTYTTPPLTEDIVTAGFPLVTLYAQADTADLVFGVYLEEVSPNGQSTMISQGFIRSSHRTPWTAPYDTHGVPWTSSLEADVLSAPPLTGEPVKLHWALEPVANRWDKGNRIRVTVVNADETVVWVIPQNPPPQVSLWRDAEYPSRIELHTLSE